MELHERIRNRRIELGLSQDDLAKKIGYKSRSTINKIEMGKNDIPQSKVSAFAKALDTTPSYLLGIEESSKSKHLELKSTDSKLNTSLSSIAKSLNHSYADQLFINIAKSVLEEMFEKKEIEEFTQRINERLPKDFGKEQITFAAHFDGNEFTEDELEEIRRFAEFLKAKRK